MKIKILQFASSQQNFILVALILLFVISCTEKKEGIGGELTEKKVCNCPSNSQPVCGNDGRTYVNSCFAQCAGVSSKEGSC